MRFSLVTLLLAASTTLVSAYDFDSADVSGRDLSARSRRISRRSVYNSLPSARLSRRAQDVEDLIAVRDLIDTLLEERSIFKKKMKTEPLPTVADQKAAAAELQKWSLAEASLKKAVENIKTNPVSKKMEMDIRKCYGHNQEGQMHYNVIATGKNDPLMRQRKPKGPPCTFSNGQFTNLP